MSHQPLVSLHQKFFDLTMEQAGVWLVYTRSDHRFRCLECYNPSTGDSRSDCEQCFGTGYKVTLERWFATYSQSLFRAPQANVPLAPIGVEQEHMAFVFSPPRLIPVALDRFFVVEWTHPRDLVDSEGAQPTKLSEALRIHFVEPFIAGQVIYYTAHCFFISEDKTEIERSLFRTPVRVSRK